MNNTNEFIAELKNCINNLYAISKRMQKNDARQSTIKFTIEKYLKAIDSVVIYKNALNEITDDNIDIQINADDIDRGYIKIIVNIKCQVVKIWTIKKY